MDSQAEIKRLVDTAMVVPLMNVLVDVIELLHLACKTNCDLAQVCLELAPVMSQGQFDRVHSAVAVMNAAAAKVDVKRARQTLETIQ